MNPAIIAVALLVCFLIMGVAAYILSTSQAAPPAASSTAAPGSPYSRMMAAAPAATAPAASDSSTTGVDDENKLKVDPETGYYEYPERILQGDAIERHEDAKKDACASICNDDTECVGFTWSLKDKGTCVLQKESPLKQPLMDSSNQANNRVYLKEPIEGVVPVPAGVGSLPADEDGVPQPDKNEFGYYLYPSSTMDGVAFGSRTKKNAKKSGCAAVCNKYAECGGFVYHPKDNGKCAYYKPGARHVPTTDANWKVFLKEAETA